MARVACLTMLRNELALTPPFIAYHAALFGAENLYVFDNGSTDAGMLAMLDRIEASGVHVDRRYGTAEDFGRKGKVLGDLIERLDGTADYDFYIPLDADEFVALRTSSGYTADPGAIHRYLDRLRGSRNILKVTQNLANLLGSPDRFLAAPYSKTVWPHGVFRSMDLGFHTGTARDGGSPYQDCDLVYVHFHYRPYEEVVEFAKQKLRTRLSEEELADPARLHSYRGMGWHMVHYIENGPEAYYRQFRSPSRTVAFAGLGERFAQLGVEAPFAAFRLPPAPEEVQRPPRVIVDEASTSRLRGWAVDPTAPGEPVFLRFLVDGALAWEGACDGLRPDVRKSGQPTDRAGFDFRPGVEAPGKGEHILTIEDRNGNPVRMIIGGQVRQEAALVPAVERAGPGRPVYSHIDSFRNGRVQGWVLRTIPTPEGPRLLGRCTVALVHGNGVVTQAVADIVRPDVAKAMNGEERCGFLIEVPRSLQSPNTNAVFRLLVMPERQELTGSPCVVAAPLASMRSAVA